MKIFSSKRFLFFFFSAITVATTTFYLLQKGTRPASLESISLNSTSAENIVAADLYQGKVQPIFNARCIACHACYNSPCQLDLTSYEGVRRGALKRSYYDHSLLTERQPTRLGIDGKSVSDWRHKNFFPVVPDEATSKESFKTTSALWRMVNMTRRPGPGNAWNSEVTPWCADSRKAGTSESNGNQLIENNRFGVLTELDQYERAFPFKGMPYGLPPLNDRELNQLHDWFRLGNQGPSPEALEALRSSVEFSKEIFEFESFFNASDFKSRLSARYIYEHLFLAHIYFEETEVKNQKEKIFFRLVRAKNALGEPDEIATVRPYDNPGREFFYRLKKYTATIVHKNHIPYAFNLNKLAGWKKRFLQSEWKKSNGQSVDTTLPDYGINGANPFITFMAIPAEARARFLIDDALYHTMTFIKGPVCNGQVAVGVIRDNFWVMYVDPTKDVSVTHPEFLEENAKLMNVPANYTNFVFKINEIRENYSLVNEKKYALYKQDFLAGLGLNFVWDGDGFNANALLTIYRHNDSATVLKGAHGQTPKTLWILDYPIFEDIYYNLVAGYNVFGMADHQVTTRLHMDHSRVDAEDLFISLLPQENRKKIRSQWTKASPKGAGADKLDPLLAAIFKEKGIHQRMNEEKPYRGIDLPTQISFETEDHKTELIKKIFSERFSPAVRGNLDRINHAINNPPINPTLPEKVKSFADAERWLSSISGSATKFAKYLPDAGYVRIKLPDGLMKVYTLIHNKEHFNVSFLIYENVRRDFEKDSVNFIPGFAASYPNIYFDVAASDLPKFIKELKSLNGDRKSWKTLLKNFGVLRSSPAFWPFNDWLRENAKAVDPIEGAPLDLNRYGDDT